LPSTTLFRSTSPTAPAAASAAAVRGCCWEPPLLGASMIALFSPPSGLEGLALVLWFAVFAITCELFDSILNANYGALLPELFPAEERRAVANALRQGFQLIAMIVSLALGVRESPRHSTLQRPRFLRGLGQILSIPSFWAVGLTGACYSIALAIVLSGIQLYVRYTLGLPVAYSFFLQAAVILIAAGGLALWSRMITRIGALRTWRIAFVVLTASFVAMFFATGLLSAVAAGIVMGRGRSGMMATNDLVVARVLDADAARTGEHREGLFLSAFGVFGRLNGAVTGLALASLGVFFGYNSGADPGSRPDLAFRVYLCAYPFALTL